MAAEAKLPRTARHLPHGEGRLPETAYNGGPPLPDVPGYKVDAVLEWLCAHRNTRRSMNAAAPLLAMICALHEKQEHMPVRRRLAEWLRDQGYVEWTSERPNAVDKVLVMALANQEISFRYVELEGNTRSHPSVIRLRYAEPCRELWDAWRGRTTPRITSSSTQPKPRRATG